MRLQWRNVLRFTRKDDEQTRIKTHTHKFVV